MSSSWFMRGKEERLEERAEQACRPLSRGHYGPPAAGHASPGPGHYPATIGASRAWSPVGTEPRPRPRPPSCGAPAWGGDVRASAPAPPRTLSTPSRSRDDVRWRPWVRQAGATGDCGDSGGKLDERNWNFKP